MKTNDTGWSLHPQLAADCHKVFSDGLCEVLLHRNASLHWFLLVPRTTHLDLLDLPAGELAALMQRASNLGSLLKTDFDYPRVNVAALGLLVPQLHLHLIGRSPEDPCWPNPVWGQLPDGPAYQESDLSEISDRLHLLFGESE